MTEQSAPLFSALVERAMRVAARQHREQTRKASDLPYITHPAGMAILLVKAGFTEDAVLAAALLHDTLEDTPYSSEELAGEFPADVGRYVAALSEQKLDEAGGKRPWRIRKEEHIAEVAAAPVGACAVVLADKLHNLACMLYDWEEGQEIWSRFNAPPAEVLWYHRTIVETAAAGDDPRLQVLADQCREMISRLERAAEEQTDSER